MKKFLISFILIYFTSCVYASDELSKQATAFYSDNNYNKTMDLLLQIDENSRSPQDWLLLGNLYSEKNEKDNAIFMYQKAIFKDKKYYKAYYNLANIYLEDGQTSLAIENYKKALRYEKTNPYVFYNLGCAYLEQGKIKNAKGAFFEAITLKNDIPEFQYNMAFVYKSLDKNSLAQTHLDNYNKLTGQKD